MTERSRSRIARSVSSLLFACALAMAGCSGEISTPADEEAPDPESVSAAADAELEGLDLADDEGPADEGMNDEVASADEPSIEDDLDGPFSDEAVPFDGDGGDGFTPLSHCADTNGFHRGRRRHLTFAQVVALAHKAGVRCGPNLVRAAAIAGVESANYPFRWHRNTNCSIDRGLWQINSIHGKGSTFGLLGNAQAMYRISSHGKHWGAWAGYTSGRYKRYRDAACVRVRGLCGRSTRCR